MKKKNFIQASVLIAAVSLVSCTKNDLPPINKNSELKMENITFNGLAGTDTTNPSIKGYYNLEFLVNKADTTLPPDTVRFANSFALTGNSQNQSIFFDTPDKAKILNCKVKFVVTAGIASSMTLGNFQYLRNGNAYFGGATNLQDSAHVVFTATRQVTF
ncbi:hypothetical protein [Taibaiella koreensis]|uniref:hypothetical protein n=1 Tax=Taibaiella koreensis TaxID=1268548 RepID=UPI000E5A06CC|nr:hypothetical protein [Taibaiella koreensis]